MLVEQEPFYQLAAQILLVGNDVSRSGHHIASRMLKRKYSSFTPHALYNRLRNGLSLWLRKKPKRVGLWNILVVLWPENGLRSMWFAWRVGPDTSQAAMFSHMHSSIRPHTSQTHLKCLSQSLQSVCSTEKQLQLRKCCRSSRMPEAHLPPALSTKSPEC